MNSSVQSPIYFTKVEFVERIGCLHPRSYITLDLVNRELSYRILNCVYQMPAIEGSVTEEYSSKKYTINIRRPARWISSCKTEFKRELIRNDTYEPKVVFMYGIKLNNSQFEELLPLCNALDFELYRNKEMRMNDIGYVAYRDELKVNFCGITNSHIPLLKLPMSYYYDEKHIWPSEKLYRHIVTNIFCNCKALKDKYIEYGAFSCPY